MTAAQMWAMIAALGAGTYAIRFSFLGLLGGRELPDWALRLLRYTPVAVLPAIAVPGVLLPEGGIVPLHAASVAATLLVGWWRRSAVLGAAAGAALLSAGTLL